MRVRMVPDFMALLIFALQQAEILIGVASNHEKRCRSVLALQDIENLRRILRVGTIVEADGDFFALPSQLLDAVGERNTDVTFVHNRARGRIEAKRSLPLLRDCRDTPNVAITFE